MARVQFFSDSVLSLGRGAMHGASQVREDRADRLLKDRSFTKTCGITAQLVPCIWHVHPGNTTAVLVKRVHELSRNHQSKKDASTRLEKS